MDMLVDNTGAYSTFSFMNGFSGYNQIKMVEEDRGKTTFITFEEHSATKLSSRDRNAKLDLPVYLININK